MGVMILSQAIKTKEPEVGDFKIDHHFAWFPREVDGFNIWLEGYKKVYQYRRRDRWITLGHTPFLLKDCAAWDLIAVQRKSRSRL